MELTQEQLRNLLKKGNRLRKSEIENESNTAYGVGILIISGFILFISLIF